jgi:hypothetical protein
MLFAVCRGKISEGIDFSDEHCRCVCIVGVPFPNTQDLQLRLKKDDHDAKARANPGMLNGSAWYSLQAFRALNQAIGRCIRHQNDHGAIVLFDERYTEARNVNSISKWIRPNLRTYKEMGQALMNLNSFYLANLAPVPAIEINNVPASTQQQQQQQLEVQPNSEGGKRKCCVSCSRPLVLNAKCTEFETISPFLTDAVGAAKGTVAKMQHLESVLLLNPKCVSKMDRAVYSHEEKKAYVELVCVCGKVVGVQIEAANDPKVIDQVWMFDDRLLKI